jgi:hypothetical protein
LSGPSRCGVTGLVGDLEAAPSQHRGDLGRARRIGDHALQWKHDDCTDSECPLGKTFVDVSDVDRLRLISKPDALHEFATNVLKSAFALAEAVEKTLLAAKAKE